MRLVAKNIIFVHHSFLEGALDLSLLSLVPSSFTLMFIMLLTSMNIGLVRIKLNYIFYLEKNVIIVGIL